MAIEYADSHGHLTMVFDGGEMKGAPRAPSAAEVKELVGRAREAGVTRILVPATEPDDQRRTVEIAEGHEGVYAAVGFHPHEAKEFDEDRDLRLFEELCASKKVVAVGEIGLDYHYDHSPKEAQRYVLEAQLRFAQEKGLPVLLHNRESEQDLLPILERLAPGDPANLRGVFHSFCADEETGLRALALGYLVSFSGMLTFKSADNVREAAAALPLASMLLETDAPYLAPAPFRGKPNESAYLPRTAAKLAEVRGVPIAEVARVTTANFKRLFRVS
jgi:TatD DNase family protein